MRKEKEIPEARQTNKQTDMEEARKKGIQKERNENTLRKNIDEYKELVK